MENNTENKLGIPTEINNLINASENGDIKIVQELIKAKVDINSLNENGDTALINASFK